MRSTLALLVLLLISAPVSAHPGHASPEASTVQHYLTSPVHLWPLLAIVVTLVVAGRLLTSSKRKR
jgi:hypothetical protein